MTRPDATVVVPTMGGRNRLPVLLQALSAQRGVTLEVVVVVDSDVDGTAAMLEGWRERLDLKVIVFPSNRGRASALSAGFAAARGRVLIRQDDDLEPHEDVVRNHVAHHDRGPVGVIGMCPDVFEATPYAQAYGVPADKRIRASSYALPPDDRWRMWSANVSVTRETYDRVGTYDEAFREYGWEDIDWGYRLHQQGIPVIIPRDLEALHHNPATSVSDRATRAFSSSVSRRFFESKHGPVLPQPGGTPSAWSRLVERVARRLPDEQAVRRWSSRVDRALPVLPQRVGEKLAALLVEAAGESGRRQA